MERAYSVTPVRPSSSASEMVLAIWVLSFSGRGIHVQNPCPLDTFLVSYKISLDISCESSAWQIIHMKCQDLFSMKNKKISCLLQM